MIYIALSIEELDILVNCMSAAMACEKAPFPEGQTDLQRLLFNKLYELNKLCEGYLRNNG